MESESELLPAEVSEGTSVGIEAEKSKAMQKVQAALVIAKRFPRDEIRALKKIETECLRPALAEKAEYAYPRGGEKVTGPTIRLAEVIARHWGNCQYGFRELEQVQGKSVVETFCWDLETNTQVQREFSVSHAIQLSKAKGGGKKILTDPRDVYEMVANQAQRRVRACILEVIPGDVVDKALAICRATLQKGNGEPLIDRITRLILNFSKQGISKETIEKRIKHKAEDINAEEIVDLTAIYNSIRDGQSKREDWFDFKGPAEGGKAEELASKLAAKKAPPPKAELSEDEKLPFEK